eukprot:XP_011665144.1 PREDICTED: uncharacterized protein LOC105438695 [Strongylocentrotus purpuratus]
MSGLAIFLIALMIGSSQACRCAFTPLGQRYCNSKFAILAKVTQIQESITRNGPRTYTLEVGAIFRDEDGDITRGTSATVKSSSSSAACGVSLEQYHTYILAGGKQSTDLWLNSCSAISIDMTSSSLQEQLEIVSLVLSVPEQCPYLPGA